MAPPFVNVVETMTGLLEAKTLACAVELGLPDLLGAEPRSGADIAAETGTDADAIQRLLTFLISRGYFRRTGGDRFANNARSEILMRGHPFSARAWVEFFGSAWNAEIWNHLAESINGKTSAAEAAFGVPFFDYLNERNPDAGVAFNGAMSVGSRLQAILVGERVDLSRVTTLCDVGGGTGAVAAHLALVHPRMHATVLDLPALEPHATKLIEDAGLSSRCRFVAGDFFERVPEGHDLYTLFAIVHDWGDASARRILTIVRAAMPPGGRVMVVEKPLPPDDGPDFSKASDMMMLAYSDGGRERTIAEYRTLFGSAGFEIRSRTLLPSMYEVFELSRAESRDG